MLASQNDTEILSEEVAVLGSSYRLSHRQGLHKAKSQQF